MARRRERGERGAAAVEFALVSIVFLTLICGIIQASLFFWGYNVASHAAREGARRYAVDPCNVSTKNITLTQSRAAGAASTAIIVAPVFKRFATGTTIAAGDAMNGDEVTVTVSFSAQSVGGLLPAFPAITKAATARIEDVEECP